MRFYGVLYVHCQSGYLKWTETLVAGKIKDPVIWGTPFFTTQQYRHSFLISEPKLSGRNLQCTDKEGGPSRIQVVAYQDATNLSLSEAVILSKIRGGLTTVRK